MNAYRFSGFQPEARLRATLGQDAPCGRGVSGPSPQAPPRQARRISYFLNLKFYSIFFKKLRGRGAVGQRKFGFQTKLPGRKRPSSGVFSDLRSEARHTPRRPLSLPCGRGVSGPSPQAPPRQARRISYFLNLKFYSIFFKKLRGQGAEPPTRSALRAAAKRFERNPPKAGS